MGRILECETCGDEYDYDSDPSNHNLDQCRNCVQKRRRREKMWDLMGYLGGECQRCGYSECAAALSFHHRDPDEKEFSIGANINRSREVLIEEVEKCDLLCQNCHREVECDVSNH